ncbi:MAG: hypothetical protein ABI306_09085 [Caulobacteraceae bacterium]
MTAQRIPEPDFTERFVGEDRYLARWARNFLTGLYNRVGQDVDKVDDAHTMAANAVPQPTQVVAGGGLQIGGAMTGNVAVALYAAITAVALLPTNVNQGDWAFAQDGRKNGEGAGSGTGVPCFWDGHAWKAVDTGATVSA